MIGPARAHPLWLAFVLHRLSGVALALFLPLHFWLLSQALGGAERLDGALRFTDHPLVKLAETGLVVLLAAHAFGGIRLLALELLPWSAPQKTLAAAALGGAVLVGGLFALQVV